MAVGGISIINYFLPIFSFLLVFIVCYAILQKTKVLGESNHATNLFISLILSSFFIVQTQMVDFVQFASSWVTVFVIIMFFIFLLLAFVPEKDILSKILGGGNWFGWVILALAIIFFISASTYIFQWTVNISSALSWMNKEWFQFALLIVISAVVASMIKK